MPLAPPTPHKYWLIIEKTDQWSLTGKTITITTDVACHLWMHWHPLPPGRHLRIFRRRGVDHWKDPHWGFEEYTSLEQAESGDTLIHTFVIDPWPLGMVLWYQFVGKIADLWSPSISPWWWQTDQRLAFSPIFTELWSALPVPWNAGPTRWELSTDDYISPPSSLYVAPGYRNFVCTVPATTNLTQGRMTIWKRSIGEVAALWYLFRNQAPLGQYLIKDCYALFLWEGLVRLFYYENGNQHVMDEQVIPPWPHDQWYRTRCTWLVTPTEEGSLTLQVKLEIWETDHWTELATLHDPNNYYSDTGIARCGFRQTRFLDDTLIEGFS